MSPLPVRRYRAERLLRQEFEVLRGRVIDTARGRLLASGVLVDQSDLEACYGQAWQGLYTAVLDGQRIVNPVSSQCYLCCDHYKWRLEQREHSQLD